MKTFKQFLEDIDYRSSHTAPSSESGDSPLHAVSPNTYPNDFHGKDGFHIYADYGQPFDRESYNIIRNAKDKPNAPIKIYRAVPKKTDITEINPGDWVTGSKQYAHLHGQSVLNGDYKILTKTVPAHQLYTDGNSVHEYGYDPH